MQVCRSNRTRYMPLHRSRKQVCVSAHAKGLWLGPGVLRGGEVVGKRAWERSVAGEGCRCSHRLPGQWAELPLRGRCLGLLHVPLQATHHGEGAIDLQGATGFLRLWGGGTGNEECGSSSHSRAYWHMLHAAAISISLPGNKMTGLGESAATRNVTIRLPSRWLFMNHACLLFRWSFSCAFASTLLSQMKTRMSPACRQPGQPRFQNIPPSS